jgi:hypothetical protein
MVRPSIAFLIASSLTLAACDETDAVAVRIRLRDDLSGTVRTSGLQLPSSGGPVQQASQGVTWENRVAVLCVTGSFPEFSKLKIADISFSAGEGGDGIGFARVVLPRGEAARWPKAFVPLSPEERKSVASALDPTEKTESVGDTIKIEIELPSAVVGNGVIGKTRGTKATAEGTVATLIVPINTATTPGDPIVWHLTWQR